MKKNVLSYIRLFWILLLCCAIGHDTFAQEVIKLWEHEVKPYYIDNDLIEKEKEVWGTRCLYDVTEPTLTIYRAIGESVEQAVLVIPRGGYDVVAIHHESHDVARTLSMQGITAGVLKYRLPNALSSDQPHLVPISDARRAMKLLRKASSLYGFDENSVGIMGFSAGSHLATVLSFTGDADGENRPDFSVLVYGVTRVSNDNIKWLQESLYHRPLTK